MSEAPAAASTPGLHVDANVVADGEPIACVSIVHGVGDHGGRYVFLRDRLRQRRIVSQTVDLRGHGRSPGPRTDVGDFAEYCQDVEYLMARTPSPANSVPQFLLGHSMGGVVAAIAAARTERRLAGLILLSPGLQPAMPLAWLVRWLALALGRCVPALRLPLGIRSNALTSDPAMQAEDRSDPMLLGNATARWGRAFFLAADDARAALRRLQIPILALHGDADTVASAAGTKAALVDPAGRDVQVEIVGGARHELFREQSAIRTGVANNIAGWICRHVDATNCRE